MLDRKTFLRPIAHRGLHSAKRGIIENTEPAFAEAIAKGYGIECDLRPATGGLPIVFHDETLNRLVEGRGPADLFRMHPDAQRNHCGGGRLQQRYRSRHKYRGPRPTLRGNNQDNFAAHRS